MTPKNILLAYVIFRIVEHFFYLGLTLLNLREVGRHKDVPERYRGKIDPERYSKSRAYTYTKSRFGLLSETYDIFLLFLFVFLGGFTYLEHIAVNWFGSEMVRGIFFVFAISLGKSVLDLPFSVYATFVIEEKFGFNKMTKALFVKDFFKKWFLSMLFGFPLIYFLIWVIQKAGNLWWVYGFLGMTVFQLLVMWIYPTWIAPIFNKFVPLEAGELRRKIMEIASKIEFKISDIFVMDGSKRSSHSNAYFTGFGKNRRIVLFDTLIKNLSTDELVSVLAHEMGHNKLKHIQKGLFLSLGFTFLAFYVWSYLLNYSSLYRAFGLDGYNLFPAIVIFPLIMGPVSFFMAPFLNMFSRKHEYEADAFAADVTGNPVYLQEALFKLNYDNLSNLTPHPSYSFFYYSHPSLDERIDALEKKKK